MKQITTILFDMDNTLIDRQLAARALMHHIVNTDFATTKSQEEIETIVDRMMVLDDEGATPKDIVFSQYIEEYGIKEHNWEHYNHLWWEHL